MPYSSLQLCMKLTSHYYSTFRQGCPAGVKIHMSDDCPRLTVTDICMNHNSKVLLCSIV